MSVTASANPKRNAPELQVGGLARLSTCDWPGELAATIFCQGCGWDCAYCHNPRLRSMQDAATMPWGAVLAFLESRRGLLDGVVFSGGEPTLQLALPDAIGAIRTLGFRVALHTAGMMPERIAPLLPLLDWVGFDIKAPFSTYSRITGVEQSGTNALASLRLLLASGVPYEVRTTLHPALLSLEAMLELRAELLSVGVTHYGIQRFRSTGVNQSRLLSVADQPQISLPPDYGDRFLSFEIR